MKIVIDIPFTGQDWAIKAATDLKLRREKIQTEFGARLPLRGQLGIKIDCYPADKRRRSNILFLTCIYKALKYAKIVANVTQIEDIYRCYFHHGSYKPRIVIQLFPYEFPENLT